MCRLVPSTGKAGSALSAGSDCGPLALHTAMTAVEDSLCEQGASAVPFLPVGDANRDGVCSKRQQHQPRKAKSFCGKPKWTLLVAYLPRCATGKDVQNAFALAGISPPHAANVVSSTCFGFVKFSDHDAAMTALQACAKGQVGLRDPAGKVWHVKASWARAELGDFKKAS